MASRSWPLDQPPSTAFDNSSTGGGSTYSVAVSGMKQSGTVIATIPADVATNTLGESNIASTSNDNTVTFDNVAPSVTINQAATLGDPTNASTVNFTVVFSEAVTGFTTGDVLLTGTAGATTAVVSGSGTTYNVAVSGMTQPGTVTVTVPAGVATDAAGNTNTASTSTDNSVMFDNIDPTVQIEQAVGQADPTNASTVNFTVVFSEAVTGFTTGDVLLTGTAGATIATITGGGTTYNVAVSGMTQPETVVLSVPAGVATDAAGNLNTASVSTDNSIAFENIRPTVAINQAPTQTDPTRGSPVNFTVVFSEPVTGFAAGDVTLGGTAGAMAAEVTGSGTTYNVAVSGMTQPGTVTVSVPAGVATDAAGNVNAASTSTDDSVAFDNIEPTVSISDVMQTEGNSGLTDFVFTVSLSKPSLFVTTVHCSTADGTATAGSDYTPLADTILTFNPGEATKMVAVQVNGDTLLEPDETFTLRLATPDGATIADAEGLGTITNDDPKAGPPVKDTQAPTAAAGKLASPPARQKIYRFSVSYTDNVLVSAASIDAKDILIVGPRKIRIVPNRVWPPKANAKSAKATYQFSAPGGAWDYSDNGTYTIWLMGKQVKDSSGNYAAKRSLGKFTAKYAKPRSAKGAAAAAAKVFSTAPISASVAPSATVQKQDPDSLLATLFSSQQVL